MPSGLDYFVIEKTSSGVINSLKKIREIQQKACSSAGIIRTSLWEAMRQKGIDPDLIVDYAEVFSWQIDFLTEPRVGDRYKVVWERKEAVGGKKISDRIIGAQYMSRERTYTAILFTYPDGRSDYYSIKGDSLRRAFLRAPLQYRRISSFFTNRRYHPILKIFRPHLGSQ